MKRRISLVPILASAVSILALLIVGFADQSETANRNRYFTNGQWFDGKRFRKGSYNAVNGALTRKAPSKITKTVDLQNGFAIPPLADAHTHNFDGPYNLDNTLKAYLSEGVFHAKVQTNPRKSALSISDKVHQPRTVDVAYANGGITSSYRHGVEIYEGLALFYRTGGFDAEQIKKLRGSRLAEDDAYYLIDTADDIEKNGP